MKLYVSYQVTGGTDDWVPVHADTALDTIKPAFVTILACDKLINKQSTKEIIDAAKYLGPMYFDLDDESDIEGVIADANKLVTKLYTYGLTDSDIEIYLSGKKGLHVLVPPSVFMEKVTAVSRLPAIYKELAFKLAVDSTDFAVYSGRSGRMFRTCYRQRDNGNWKVRISAAELKTLTPETYDKLCKHPRDFPATTPTYRAKFAILYEGIFQTVAQAKRVKVKPVDAATLRKHLPIVQRVMQGTNLKEGVGFNKIAIQLAVYAREAHISEDDLVSQCSGLINGHSGDGYRYNSPRKREAEIRRMFNYIDEGVGYAYSIHPIQALFAPVKAASEFSDSLSDDEGSSGSDEEITEVIEDSSGLFLKGANYFVTTDQGDKHILNARFLETAILKTPESEQIACITAKIQVGSKIVPCNLERADFVSSSGLHRAVSSHGASFTGNDVHARYIYTHMLRESEASGKVVYATDREGLDVLKMPMCKLTDARKPFVVWSDAFGVRLPAYLQEQGLDVRFVGYPSPEGIMKTDLALTPTYPVWAEEANNRQRLWTMTKGLLTCQDANTIAKLVGWMVASFYTQLFHAAYGKFPLLHLNGAAGSGKSEMTECMLHLFYCNGDPVMLSPGSTTFAIATAVAGSASIPIVIDEYKPSEMGKETHSALKSLFRNAYNSNTISRGGGNRQKDSFGALTQVRLGGPIVFIAEAIEQETAVLERSVPITIKRPYGRLAARYSPLFHDLKNNRDCLSVIGQHLAASIVQNTTVAKLREEFSPMFDSARAEFMPQASDYEGAASQEILAKKEGGKERVIYGHTVALFGLRKFQEVVTLMLPEHKDELESLMKPVSDSIYTRMGEASANTAAEYIKVMRTMSDMSRFADGDGMKLQYGFEYEFGSVGELTTLVLVGRAAYGRYKQYCKAIDVPALFIGIDPFIHAMKTSNVFITTGQGTARLKQETLVLNYEQLVRMGMPAFTK